MDNIKGKVKLNDELLEQVTGCTDNTVNGGVGSDGGPVQNCYNTGSI